MNKKKIIFLFLGIVLHGAHGAEKTYTAPCAKKPLMKAERNSLFKKAFQAAVNERASKPLSAPIAAPVKPVLGTGESFNLINLKTGEVTLAKNGDLPIYKYVQGCSKYRAQSRPGVEATLSQSYAAAGENGLYVQLQTSPNGNKHFHLINVSENLEAAQNSTTLVYRVEKA